MAARLSSTELSALQAALAAEHAAVYGYAVVAAHLTGSRRTEATADYQAHLARRDALRERVAASGATPVAAAAGYELPFTVTGAARAAELAALLESRLADVYANAVQAGADGGFRSDAAAALSAAAVRAARWSGSTQAFPGVGTP